MRNLWAVYRETSLMLKITAALVLGVIAGLLFGSSVEVIQPLGDLLMRLLKFLIIPLVLFTLMAGVNQTNPGQLGKMGGKVLLYYILTSAFALTIGIFVASFFNPGTGLSIPRAAEVEVPEAPSFTELLLGIVPVNIFEALLNLDLLAIIFTALVFGFAVAAMRHGAEGEERRMGDVLYKSIEAGEKASIKIMEWVLLYLPIGIFAIIAATVGSQGTESLMTLGKLIMVVYAGLLVQLVIYGLLLAFFKVSPLAFFKQARTAMLTAFATQSSLGTLPVTINAARNIGLKEGLYGFSLPLGATINMDGAAIRIGASAIFAANVVGIDLSMTALIGIVLTGTLASIGTAGVPGAGLITISTVLLQAGLPLEVVALIGSVDAILGMGATATNVTGDLVGTTIIHQTDNERDPVAS
ncbi:dicarboxylate/amino acid:cation symporter [Bacillus marinisedimentorum]|uniref:dicarboxylate/amino acid:cation symporter n=1 Tax=Bacillus marinisedimentorum TaxID=1821260 RepID=UPI0007E17EAD|nr:dicarboxylate/amino acid:cation symporter [Bacillus marinisedimentorum]